MQIWDSLAGIVTVTLTSAELETALKCLNASGIELRQMRYLDEMSCSFQVHRKDLALLKRICHKRGETFQIVSKKGLFWIIKRMPGRPVLLTGILALLAMTLFLPTRIYFICVEGNEAIPDIQILSAAEDCGIRFGASRREVRSERVKNALLYALPQLQWAGVNTAGCVATISVQERSEPEQEAHPYGISNIVASRDGYILSGTATQGNPKFQVGQAVKAGEILISGYTDHGICIQGTRANGEVFAQTNRDLKAVTPRFFAYRGQADAKKHKISIIIRKKRINLWKDSGISGASCDRMYQEYYITLPGGFLLPVSLVVETYTPYTAQDRERPYERSCAALSAFAQKYLKQQMAAGTIQESAQTFSSEDGLYRLNGIYRCTEMIGREQHEQIGVQHGKSD